MNQIQRFIDSIRDAPHDAVIVAGIFAIPVLIALWIVNRMRHPERGLLHALVIASVGFVVVPCVSSAVIILWVRTGGDSIQGAVVGIFLFFLGFWAFRRWLRSAPRTARPAKELVAPVAHAAPRSDLADEVAGLRAEVTRIRAERQAQDENDTPRHCHVNRIGRRCCMIQLRREWGRFSNFSFRTPQRRISAYPARPSG